jgi:hypothetical protein
MFVSNATCNYQKKAQLATEIFNNISCEKSVAGPKEFSLGC